MDSNKTQEDLDYENYKRYELPWKAWGSPVGLSIFFISLAIVVAILRYSFVMIR